MSEVLLVDVTDRIALLTLNRPASRNALSSELLRALPASMAELDADDDVDVIVLTGADPAFCAGLDLKELGSSGANLGAGSAGGGGDRGGRRGPFPAMTKPVIGAVNGATVTGGLELALACDFLVASERASFADTHARVGIQPGWGLTVLLPQAVGLRRAREMSFTGNFVAADEALRIGLVDHVVPHEALVPFARRLAADIVSNDQAAVRRIRRTYDEVAAASPGERWAVEGAAAREWQGRGFDPAEVERRRQSIVDRGRSQQR